MYVYTKKRQRIKNWEGFLPGNRFCTLMRQEAEAVERVDAQHGQPEVECHTREHSERDPLIETIQ